MIDLNAAPLAERPGPRSWRSDGGLVHKGNPAVAELAVLPQWVLWKGKLKPDGRIEKVPYCVGGRAKASATDPRTWDTFDACWTSAFVDGQADGIGFVFCEGDPYCGVDLDECRDPATGEITEESLFWLDYFDTYAEVSPSRTGVKLIARATLPGRGRKAGGLEIYDRGRFFAITGDHLDGTPEEIGEAQEATEAVLAQITSRSKTASAARHACTGATDRVDLGDDDDPRWRTCTDEVASALEALIDGFPASDIAECLDCSGTPPEDSTRSGWMARLARLLRERLDWDADQVAAGLAFLCERHGWTDKLGREVKRAVELVLSDPADGANVGVPVDQLPSAASEQDAPPTCSPLACQQPPWEGPLDRPMFDGPLGEIVRRIDPLTEADPRGVMLCALTAFGNLIGRSLYLPIGTQRHFPIVHTLLLGDSYLGRKGTATSIALDILGAVDPEWHKHNVRWSINSGEGMLNVVRTIDKEAKERVEQHTGMTHPPGDKRAFFVLEELGETLRKANSPNSSILPFLRRAWDGGVLENTSLSNPMRITGAAVGVVGMVTREELITLLDLTQLATGSLNRCTMLAVHASKFIRKPPVIDVMSIAGDLLGMIRENLPKAGGAWGMQVARSVRGSVPFSISPEADDLLGDLNEAIRIAIEREKGSWLGTGQARAYAQILRLSLIYAALDGTEKIERRHVDAARDLVGLSVAAMTDTTTKELGDPIAERLIAGLNEQPGQALSRTEISNVLFNRHCPAKDLERAITQLIRMGMLKADLLPTRGRHATVLSLTARGIRT